MQIHIDTVDPMTIDPIDLRDTPRPILDFAPHGVDCALSVYPTGTEVQRTYTSTETGDPEEPLETHVFLTLTDRPLYEVRCGHEEHHYADDLLEASSVTLVTVPRAPHLDAFGLEIAIRIAQRYADEVAVQEGLPPIVA